MKGIKIALKSLSVLLPEIKKNGNFKTCRHVEFEVGRPLTTPTRKASIPSPRSLACSKQSQLDDDDALELLKPCPCAHHVQDSRMSVAVAQHLGCAIQGQG